MKRTFVFSFVLGLFLGMSAQAHASANTPLAVLRSEKNAETYSDQHIGNFDDDFQSFKHTLETANVRYDLLKDDQLKPGAAKLSAYKVIVVPLCLNLPTEAVGVLSEFVHGGGKLVITDGGGNPSEVAQALMQLTGLHVTGHRNMQESQEFVWDRSPLPIKQPFAVGSLVATVQTTEGGTGPAQWVDSHGTNLGQAIVRSGNGAYLTWAPGMQGELSSNAQILTSILEDASPGITQSAAIQFSFADYQNIKQELEYLARRTDEAVKTAKQADLAVPFNTIEKNCATANSHVKAFDEAYTGRRFYEADQELSQARQDFAMAFAQSMPVRPVESRSIWLDRGTIIATKGPEGMSTLFDRLKRAGINVVYFETNNAGFCMYPTKVSVQNPETIGWDPLDAGIKEAHKRGMELHAWLWNFAVGNIRHNPIINKEADYPGPVLSTHSFSWALAGRSGALLPNNQPEFWIDPASPEGRQFNKDLAREVVSNYPVDGYQFDYIRYPFNNKGTEMGYDWAGRQRFERETGTSLDRLDEETRELWKAWKVAQVNTFVQETSTMLRKIRPGLRISAAVYAMPMRLRIAAIQQEWETWVQNGWVDTLNPMTYVPTAKELTIAAGNVREATADKALVYPGLALSKLDTAGLIEQLDTARAIGTLGTTIFACAQLDDKKISILRLGPYRRTPILTPQSDPVRASRLLVDDFAAMVNRYLQDPTKHIISDQASTNEVLSQIEAVQKEMHTLHAQSSPEELATANRQVLALQNLIKEWLRIEAFVQRGFRAQYIASYLAQVEAILSYAQHKAKTQTPAVAVDNH